MDEIQGFSRHHPHLQCSMRERGPKTQIFYSLESLNVLAQIPSIESRIRETSRIRDWKISRLLSRSDPPAKSSS
jgi:hypothetical protein